MTKSNVTWHLLLSFVMASACTIASADWPMVGGSADRSYYSAGALPNQFALGWIYEPSAKPQPAWPSSQRITDDRTFCPVVANHVVVFGSSSTDTVIALNSQTGKWLWDFTADAPVRYAPVIAGDRAIFACDDGTLYALDLTSGQLLWRHEGLAAKNDWVIGNGRLMARCGARGGPVVWEDMVYYACGVWPTDGAAVYAVRVADGKQVWANETIGTLTMDQPHGGARADSGVAPQGYLAVDEQHVYVPTGRAVPAVFDRATGKLKYYHLQANRDIGGSRVTLADRFFLNGEAVFHRDSGLPAGRLGLPPLAALPDGIVQGSGRELRHLLWVDAVRRDRRGKEVPFRALEAKRVIDTGAPISALIAVGTDAVIGQDGRVAAIDYRAQANAWWEAKIEGTPLAFAYADGCLIVATDLGSIYGFVATPVDEVHLVKRPDGSGPTEPTDDVWRQAVARLPQALRQRAGYVVVEGVRDTALLTALADQTQFNVVGIASAKSDMAALRRTLLRKSLYGARVTLLPADIAPRLPNDFADLVLVSQKQLAESPLWRIVRPFGGRIAYWSAAKRNWEFAEKGELPGAGSWTHQWANAGHTTNSGDTNLKGSLGVAWFADVDFATPNRHGQGPAPLSHRGYLIVGGVDGIACMDAYNGTQRWTYPIEGFLLDFDGIHHDVGVGETGGRFCMSDDAVFVPWGDECWKIDLETGQRVQVFKTPVPNDAVNRRWGVVLYHQGVLIGSVLNEAHRVSPRYALTRLRTESVKVFAVDAETGSLLWEYTPTHSVRNNAIAAAGDTVFLIDRPIAKQDAIEKPTRNGRPAPRLKPGEHPTGVLVSMDLRSGKAQWTNDQDIWGTQLMATPDARRLVMHYQEMKHKFFRLPSEIGGRLAVFDAQSGKRLWDKEAEYRTHPILIGDTLYAEGGAWDLETGTSRPFPFERSYGCGQISASANLLLYRSATLGYWDLSKPLDEQRTQSFGGMRPSCYINAVPASGMVLVPEGSTKCRCSYQLKSWFALRPRQESGS